MTSAATSRSSRLALSATASRTRHGFPASARWAFEAIPPLGRAQARKTWRPIPQSFDPAAQECLDEFAHRLGFDHQTQIDHFGADRRRGGLSRNRTGHDIVGLLAKENGGDDSC